MDGAIIAFHNEKRHIFEVQTTIGEGSSAGIYIPVSGSIYQIKGGRIEQIVGFRKYKINECTKVTDNPEMQAFEAKYLSVSNVV